MFNMSASDQRLDLSWIAVGVLIRLARKFLPGHPRTEQPRGSDPGLQRVPSCNPLNEIPFIGGGLSGLPSLRIGPRRLEGLHRRCRGRF